MKRPIAAAVGYIVFMAATGAQAADPPTAASEDDAAGDLTSEAERARNDRVTRLDAVITTGTRSAKAVDKIPGAITLVSSAEVSRTLALTDDATAVLARSVPGYAESSQAMSNTGETLRGRIPLRLFDGIPQGSPLREGTRNGTFTDMGVVERVEVINGPSAAEGIGAAGGIINYISKSAVNEGNEFTFGTRYSTQLEDDSSIYKVGLTWAHKRDDFDMYLAGTRVDRGMTWDANGRRIGMHPSGSLADSTSDNLFAKFGYNFGESGYQRIQLTLSTFELVGKDNYIQEIGSGDRSIGVTDTSIRGGYPGSFTPFNDFSQGQLKYTHADFLGGTLTVDAYKASQAMRYLASITEDKQDPAIAPLGTLIDQSEINSQKKGFRSSWSKSDIFGVAGLELQAGLDLVEDTAEQNLALTNRTWVPPIDYSSWAPYVQLSWDVGPVTISGGLRQENGKLDVDTWQSIWWNNRVTVDGGSLDYQTNLPNLGAIWRFADGWSAFGSWGKGFTLPNVGIALRNINTPGHSVAEVTDLQAIIVENKELGLTWRGQRAALSGSVYRSSSDFGATLSIDPRTRDYVLNRAPVEIEGVEVTGEFRFAEDLRGTMVYAKSLGYTSFTAGGPLNKKMGVSDINPPKLVTSLTWDYSDSGNVTLGQTTLLSRAINEGSTAFEQTKGYTLWDLEMNYDTGRYGRFSVGVENLTDKFYILSLSQIDGYRNYFAGRGRVFSVGYSYTF
ncbi:TonB-dependent receptor [Luteimonas chenhongjianii]|uniref:TonB-dependent receptor n=1 Tax=Luteimonas chenhongjianii TaxID=2006110 RepID=A0A290XBZ4_9GAMM|nr:TonB-dependent receptor [Luteimonas chenhongjianii]ATD66603.1 TonB-dependent receptor [Luteimonas chenhongjianii]